MAVTGFMQTHNILGVYLTYLHAKLSKNKILCFALLSLVTTWTNRVFHTLYGGPRWT